MACIRLQIRASFLADLAWINGAMPPAVETGVDRMPQQRL
jgi:hypothetical protein